MKKLMIAAAIVCAAALSQAATASWTTGGYVYMPNIDSADKTVSPWAAPSGTKSTDKIKSATQTYTVLLTLYADDAHTQQIGTGSKTISVGSGITSGSTGGKFGITDVTVSGTYTAGTTYYGTLLVTGDTDGWYMTLEASADMSDSMEIALSTAGNQQPTWYHEGAPVPPPGPIPEPTSGLLLVLGVAGLALKRKRA